jgi:ribosome-associated toxin RatA of RatAB toxin-antitoxin module
MNRKVDEHRLPLNMSRAGNRMIRVVAALLLFVASAVCESADWTLTQPQLDQLEKGGIVAEGDVATDRAAADVRAAVKVAASPEQVFLTLTDCSRALRFVPHLKRCKVIETAPDGSWQNVEQAIDYGWLVPRANYVFHAEYEKYSLIRFSNVRGDFHENRGEWVFRPLDDGRATLVTYEAHVAPAFYVPRWMMRNMLRRDLPDLMRGLRNHAETTRSAATTNAGGAGPALPGP